jgi:hypothetical protein
VPKLITYKKVKGGALYYAIFVAFVVSLICGFFILATWFFRGYLDTMISRDQLRRNVISGINLALSNPGIIPYDETFEMDLFSDIPSLVKFYKQRWGIYDILTCSSGWKEYSVSRTALVGENILKNEPVALYMADKSKYLSISGETRIKGAAYLPRLGIKRAHIEGESYTGDQIVYGEIKTSANTLPALNEGIVSYNMDILSEKNSSFAGYDKIDPYLGYDSIYNSFLDPTLVLYASKNLSLSDIFISGNVIICVDNLVEIYPSASLEDVIIYCQKAGIAKNFSGRLQIFARDTILVGENVIMNFPSCLAVISDDLNAAYIFIGKGSTISGGVILYNNERNSRKAELYIEEGAVINGQVYCDGDIEHKGQINGTLYCNGFTLKTPGAYYENHILDAGISFTDLSKYFVGFAIQENRNSEVIKWLN